MQSSRRDLLAAAGLAALTPKLFAADAAKPSAVKHSVVPWCFKETHDLPALAKFAAENGIASVELCDPRHWPMLKDLGLTCAIAGSHGFKQGPNHRGNHPAVRAKLTERVEQSAAAGVDRVITFVGMQDGPDGDITLDEAGDNCVSLWKKLMPLCESKGVTLCVEMLNTRDDTHPMKGHPGYMGDDIDFCAGLCRRVGSPNMKLLFDVYHVQIMNGDLIRRVRRHADLIGHVHTAGNPGRGELDAAQEINYPPVVVALIDSGYDGFIGHEFIPTRDPEAGLREAVRVCSV